VRVASRRKAAAALLASVIAGTLLAPASGWPNGLVGPGDTCASCHERGTFGVATTVIRLNGIDPEWGANRGGQVAVSPGGVIEVEWRSTGLGYDYGETAGFVIVPNVTSWGVSARQVSDNGRTWTVPWTVASSDEKAQKKDNWRTFVTAYEHVHKAGDEDFPGWRGYGADKDDGSALDMNGIAHDEYLGARIHAPAAEGDYTVLAGAAGMPEPLVNKGSWVELRVRVAPVSPPRVASTTPPDGATDVPVLDPLVVEFDRPMDRASTEAALSISPQPEGSYAWSAARDRLSFVPETVFAFGTRHTATLSGSARDRSGLPLGADLSFSFTTQAEPPFTVYLSSPRGGERAAGGSVRGIDGAVLGGAPPYSVSLLLSTDSGVSWGPPLASFSMAGAGAFHRNWSVPAIDSETVRIGARVRDSSGAEVLGHSRDLAVDSTPPSVAATLPAAGEVNVSRFSPLVIAFSEEMDRASAEASLSVDPPAPGGLEWEGPNLTLAPSELLYGSAAYKVSVSTAAEDRVGNSLPSAVEFGFSTEKDWTTPMVVGRTPSGSGVSAFANVVVRFNKLMRHAETESAFSIRPPLPGAFSWDLATLTFAPEDGFAYATKHNVTVNTTATDLAGLHPEADISWEFTVVRSAAPEMVARSPSGGGIPVGAEVSATFSDHMEPSSVEASFSISPPVPVRFEWDSRRSVTAVPLENLSGRTAYEVAFSIAARNSRGLALAADEKWNFTTGEGRDTIPPSVVHAEPDDAPDISPLNITVGVEDNAGVKDASIRYRLSPTSAFSERPMDLFLGDERDGAFRAVFEAPLRPAELEYEIVVSDSDNAVVLPGGGDLFRVSFLGTRDAGFAALGAVVFSLMAPLAAWAGVRSLERSRRRRSDRPASRSRRAGGRRVPALPRRR
jgi:hypothetical protein